MHNTKAKFGRFTTAFPFSLSTAYWLSSLLNITNRDKFVLYDLITSAVLASALHRNRKMPQLFLCYAQLTELEAAVGTDQPSDRATLPSQDCSEHWQLTKTYEIVHMRNPWPLQMCPQKRTTERRCAIFKFWLLSSVTITFLFVVVSLRWLQHLKNTRKHTFTSANVR